MICFSGKMNRNDQKIKKHNPENAIVVPFNRDFVKFLVMVIGDLFKKI